MKEYDPDESLMKEASPEFQGYLERFPVRLSYQDGGIADVCLTGEEPSWVINAKRGIISMIQNNMEDLSTNRNVTEVRSQLHLQLNSDNSTSCSFNNLGDRSSEFVKRKDNRYFSISFTYRYI